jgi:hypothetical protein
MRNSYKIWLEKLLGKLGAEGRVMLKNGSLRLNPNSSG